MPKPVEIPQEPSLPFDQAERVESAPKARPLSPAGEVGERNEPGERDEAASRESMEVESIKMVEGRDAISPCPLPEEERVLSSIERSLLESQVVEQIRTVYDPEIPVNVYDLGLIYDIQVADNRDVHIVMTLTSPMCPVAGILPGEVECAARATSNIGEVSVELTWDPPFTIDRIPEETRLMLGFE